MDEPIVTTAQDASIVCPKCQSTDVAPLASDPLPGALATGFMVFGLQVGGLLPALVCGGIGGVVATRCMRTHQCNTCKHKFKAKKPASA